jgi:hypothetical protein
MLNSEERDSLMKANDILMHFMATEAGNECLKRWEWLLANNKVDNVGNLISTALYDTFNEVALEWKEPA